MSAVTRSRTPSRQTMMSPRSSPTKLVRRELFQSDESESTEASSPRKPVHLLSPPHSGSSCGARSTEAQNLPGSILRNCGEREILSKPAARNSSCGSGKAGSDRFPSKEKEIEADKRPLRRELFQPEKTATSESLPRSCRRRQSRVPQKFRRSMPTSARKAEPEPEPPSKRFAPIVQGSFYGSPGGAKRREPSPPKERLPKPCAKSGSGTRARRRKAKTHANKAVSHAIRKPKKKAQQKTVEKEKPSKPEIPVNDPARKSSKKLEEEAPGRSGKITLAKATNVSYEIKNGQPVFHLRRSPRKAFQRSTPKLFNPSGGDDYLDGSPSTDKKRRRTVPSPVKFDLSVTDDDLDSSVQGIIDGLHKEDDYAVYVDDDEELAKVARDAVNELVEIQEEEDAAATIQNILSSIEPNEDENVEKGKFPVDESPSKRRRNHPHEMMAPSADGSMTFDSPPKNQTGADSPRVQDELATLAGDNEIELAEIGCPEGVLSSVESKESPSKRRTTNVVIDGAHVEQEVAAVIDDGEDAASTIRGILQSMQPPTREDVSERREVRPKRKRPLSVLSDSAANGEETRKRKRRNLQEFTTSTANSCKRDGLTQMVIDAGQKSIGAEHCSLCDFVFTVGDVDEERLHRKRHEQASGVIRFPRGGWRNESSHELPDGGRIVVVRPTDPKRHWEKVESVLEVVDSALGISPESNNGRSQLRNPSSSTAYLFVQDGRVVGFLAAEVIQKTDRVSVSSVDGGDGLRVLKELSRARRANVVAGVARVWVAPDRRRKGVARRLVDCMTNTFLPATSLAIEEFAFSHTTPKGSDFAAAYTKSSDFLTYAPTLPGDVN